MHNIQAHLRGIAEAYGRPEALVSVLPTLAIVSLEPGRPVTIEPTEQLDGQLRLDQTDALYALIRRAERAELTPREANDDFAEIIDSDSRFSRLSIWFSHVVLSTAICLILQPTWNDIWLAAVFGGVVGLLKMVGDRFTRVKMLLPVVAAFVVAGVTFLLADQGWVQVDLRAMIAPLVTFLPGAMLTVGVIELAAGELITGASRLVAGMTQLLLLAFGIVAAAQVFGTPAHEALINSPENLIGDWAPWLGVALFGIAISVNLSAPRAGVPWLLTVLLAAWLGQALASLAVGGFLAGFFGGLVLTLLAYSFERRGGPPALVTFLPGFWLLVPGAIGLIGVTEYVDASTNIAIGDLTTTLGSMLAVALGVLCGSPLSQGAPPARRRVH